MEKQIEELRTDIEEICKLIETTSRTRVKDLLGLDKRKLETELIQKEDRLKKIKENESNATGDNTTKTSRSGPYAVTITTYAWDQSDKYMKLYVTLKDVHSLSKDQITCQFTNKSIKLNVSDLNGKNHQLYIANLMENILPADSYHKVKTDTVLVMLKKDAAKTWAYVTKQESKAKESKKPKVDESADPNDSLMTMMKQMYDEGDDEMKRTITKAWSESRNKQQTM